ncbi:hypothetical protein [Endozoicomonas sp.]|uniref:hypothetical protein n=1 Tax=Endozoicomonas sp. TaxID=1892382 RepID=UPI00288478D2|nr:hypothetical protein [Endozoicomonas sp.]
MTEKQIIEEIKKIKMQLNKLEETGQISTATAITVSSILATVVVGVIHSGLVHYFFPGSYVFYGQMATTLNYGLPQYINAMLLGIINAIIPGTAIGLLLAGMDSSDETSPRLPVSESFWIGVKSALSSTGLWVMGVGGAYLINRFVYDGVWAASSMNYLALGLIPLNAIALYYNIVTHRKDLKLKALNLEHRLTEAEEVLNMRESQIEYDSLENEESTLDENDLDADSEDYQYMEEYDQYVEEDYQAGPPAYI